MKEKILTRSNIVILAAFLVPAVILTIAYAALGFYPFGDKSVLIMDMRDQYSEFFASLRYLGEGDNSLLFSWSRSMGGNFVGLFAYYIASPLSFITVLFPLKDLPVALFLLTILKSGLCGLTFAVFLEYVWNDRKGKPAVILFSSCYALMSYAVVYGMCLMWLDGMILLPLILLGIEKLIQGKKGIVYLLSLTAVFICNYYTGYMIGIFAALYLVYRLWCVFQKSQWKRSLCVCAKFAGNTLMALGISSPLLLAVVKDLMTGKLSGAGYIPEETYNFEIWYFVKRLFGGVYDGITYGGLPSVFCGLTMLVLVVLFFFMKNIHWKEKLGAGILFAVLIVSMWSVKLDMVWHCFQVPTWFPFRYAFVFSTFMILVAYRAWMNFKITDMTRRKLKKPLVIYLVFIIVLFQFMELYSNAKENIAGLDNQFGYKTIDEYRDYLDKVQPSVEAVKAEDDSFYRMEKDWGTEFSKNDAMLLGYNGMTHYSSTYHSGVNTFTSRLGIAQAHIWNSGYGSSPVTDSIFSVKYRLMTQKLPDIYKKLDEKNGVTTYENMTVLPIAFASGVIDSIDLNDEDNFKNQNQLLNLLAQTEQVSYFKPVEYEGNSEGAEWTYDLYVQSSNPVYLRMKGSDIGQASVYVEGTAVGGHFGSETNCNLYLGQFDKGETVNVTCSSDNVLKQDEWIYELDTDAWMDAYKKLAKGGLNITRQDGSDIEGTITVGEDQMIFTSIPYDEGFTVELDGKEVEKTALKMTGTDGKDQNVFLTIQAEPGEHTLSISYMPPGMMTGFLLAVIAIAAAVLYYRWEWLVKIFVKRERK